MKVYWALLMVIPSLLAGQTMVVSLEGQARDANLIAVGTASCIPFLNIDFATEAGDNLNDAYFDISYALVWVSIEETLKGSPSRFILDRKIPLLCPTHRLKPIHGPDLIPFDKVAGERLILPLKPFKTSTGEPRLLDHLARTLMKLKESIPPPPQAAPPDEESIRKWIRQMGDGDVKKREEAHAQMLGSGPDLRLLERLSREARKDGNADPEISSHLDEIILRLGSASITPDDVWVFIQPFDTFLHPAEKKTIEAFKRVVSRPLLEQIDQTEQGSPVVVASCARADSETIARLTDLLASQGISRAAITKEYTICVRKDRCEEARRILERAFREEGLRIAVIPSR